MHARWYFLNTLATLALAAIGACMAWAASIPLPFLVGPTVIVVMARKKWPSLDIPPRLREAAMVVAGTCIGVVTPAGLAISWQMWLVSGFVMVVYVALSAAVARVYLERVAKFTHATALLAGQPGGILVMMALSGAAAAQTGRVLFVHAIRVAAGPLSVALFLAWLGYPVPSRIPESEIAAPAMSWLHILFLYGSCLTGFGVARRIRLPAAELLGPILTSLLIVQMGWVTGSPPLWPLMVALAITGSSVATGIPRLSGRELVSDGFHSLVVMLIFIGLAWSAAWMLSKFSTIHPVAFFLAATPSGLTEMPAIAALLGLNATYVALIETVRFLVCAVQATWQVKALK